MLRQRPAHRRHLRLPGDRRLRTVVTVAESDTRTVQDIAGWIDDGQRFIVAERAGRVLGWA